MLIDNNKTLDAIQEYICIEDCIMARESQSKLEKPQHRQKPIHKIEVHC